MNLQKSIDLILTPLPNFHQLALLIARRADTYLVGGWIRDHLQGIASRDLDLVSANAQELAMELRAIWSFSLVLLDETHQIYRLVSKKHDITVDIAQMAGGCLAEDLGRRDFTINAIAVDWQHPDQLIDPYNGWDDLQNRSLRVVSPHSIENDPLRALRAFRFAAIYNLVISPETLDQINRQYKRLQQPAGERMNNELHKMVLAPDWHSIWPAMREMNLFPALIGKPPISVDNSLFIDICLNLADRMKEEPLTTEINRTLPLIGDKYSLWQWLRLYTIIFQTYRVFQRELLHRFCFTTKIQQGLKLTHRLVTRYQNETRSTIVDAILDDIACYGIMPIIAICYLYGTQSPSAAEGKQFEYILQQWLHQWRKNYCQSPLITGIDLIKNFKMAPGPLFKEVLHVLRKAQIAGTIGTTNEALKYLRHHPTFSN